MKICAACSQTLPKEKFSKKQWQLKQCRRCKDCIADNREVNLETSNNDSPQGASDEDLFKQPPRGECPICMLPLPLETEGTAYNSCCRKSLCCGCMHADVIENNRKLCPFCRTPVATSDKEYIERMKKRVEANDVNAMRNLGCKYYHGEKGLQQNYKKAIKLWLRAGELGDTRAFFNLGVACDNGDGVERDTKKAKHYWELAAMGGDVEARHILGNIEEEAGNMSRAMKHWMISAGSGRDDSLTAIRKCFLNGHATKDDFEKALRAHKGAKDEMKSEQREAAATDQNFIRQCR